MYGRVKGLPGFGWWETKGGVRVGGYIGLVGERDLGKTAHVGIERSIELFNEAAEVQVSFEWIPTDEIGAEGVSLDRITGIWCVPGSPYLSTAGALRAIRQARVDGVPFLGTCGGFQHALLEIVEGVAGISAGHEELDPRHGNLVISRLSCPLVEVKGKVQSEEGSWYAGLTGAQESLEGFHCNYGLAPGFEDVLKRTGVEIVARDEQGQVRAFRLRGHPFFVGTLFQPERRALEGGVHPLVMEFFRLSSL